MASDGDPSAHGVELMVIEDGILSATDLAAAAPSTRPDLGTDAHTVHPPHREESHTKQAG